MRDWILLPHQPGKGPLILDEVIAQQTQILSFWDFKQSTSLDLSGFSLFSIMFEEQNKNQAAASVLPWGIHFIKTCPSGCLKSFQTVLIPRGTPRSTFYLPTKPPLGFFLDLYPGISFLQTETLTSVWPSLLIVVFTPLRALLVIFCLVGASCL